jgi:hypothetical protein
MNGFLAGVMLRRLMKGRSVVQIERAFWIVVVMLIALFLAAVIAQYLFAPGRSAGSDNARWVRDWQVHSRNIPVWLSRTPN